MQTSNIMRYALLHGVCARRVLINYIPHYAYIMTQPPMMVREQLDEI